MSRGWWVGFAAVGALLTALHLGGLATAPPGLYADEASIGYNAWAIAQGGIDEHGAHFPLYFQAFGEYKNPVYVYLVAAVTRVLPLTATTERLPAAICSLATIAVLGAAAWTLTRRRPVVLATVVTAGFTPWLTVEGRVGFEVITLVLALAVALYCAARLLLGGGLGWAAGTGAGLGFTLYGYTTGRLLAGLFTVLVLIVLLLAARRLLEVAVVLAPVGVAYGMLGIWSLQHPGALTARYDLISITADHPSALLTAERFVRNYVTYFGAPFLLTHGDAIPRHNTEFGGMLLLGSVPAVLAGIVVCLRRWREPLSRVLIGGLLLAPVAAALTAESTPHALRSSAMVPFLLMLAVLGWAVILPPLLQPSRRLLAGVLLGAALVEVTAFEWDLFVDWPGRTLGAFDTGIADAVARAHPLARGHTLLLSSTLDQPYIQVLFVLRPDPAAYVRAGLAAVGAAVLDPARMSAVARSGDILVLSPNDVPPAGAQRIFDEEVTVTDPVVTVVGPQRQVVPLVEVYRLGAGG